LLEYRGRNRVVTGSSRLPLQDYIVQPHVHTPAMGWLLYLAAMPAALVVFMHALSLVLPKRLAQLVHYYAFLITAFFVMMSCAAYGVVVGCILRAVGYGGLIQWTVSRSAKWSMWAITGTTFRVTGSVKRNGGISGEDALKERPAVFVANHQTYVIMGWLSLAISATAP